jgi:hypothetical protein
MARGKKGYPSIPNALFTYSPLHIDPRRGEQLGEGDVVRERPGASTAPRLETDPVIRKPP